MRKTLLSPCLMQLRARCLGKEVYGEALLTYSRVNILYRLIIHRVQAWDTHIQKPMRMIMMTNLNYK